MNLQVRPEEVLEKALVMVQNSQKNYLYKCDQLKSIRQDLTVQRIRNQLTVKVFFLMDGILVLLILDFIFQFKGVPLPCISLAMLLVQEPL